MSIRVRVLVIDDHLVFAELLAEELRRADYDASAVDLAELDDQALLAHVAADPPAVVVLDLVLGPGRRGLPLVAPLVSHGCAVVVLTGDDGDDVRSAAVAAGAVEVVDKLLPLEDVLAVVERIAPTTGASAVASLTQREQEVLARLVDGRSAKEIAADLGIALPTVRTQLSSVYRKLKVDNARAAVVLAVRSGWSRSS